MLNLFNVYIEFLIFYTCLYISYTKLWFCRNCAAYTRIHKLTKLVDRLAGLASKHICLGYQHATIQNTICTVFFSLGCILFCDFNGPEMVRMSGVTTD